MLSVKLRQVLSFQGFLEQRRQKLRCARKARHAKPRKFLCHLCVIVGSAAVRDREQADHSHPGVMKDSVCSPGGTTIRGVSQLEKDGFRGDIIDAVDAVMNRQ